jgi:hypothetical protein
MRPNGFINVTVTLAIPVALHIVGDGSEHKKWVVFLVVARTVCFVSSATLQCVGY